MCEVAGILNIKTQTEELRGKALKMAQEVRRHGSDWSGIYVGGSAILTHERLSIADPQSGGQPLYSPDRKQVLAVNDEIYNHRDTRAHHAGQYDFQTGSGCEVILALYKDESTHFLEEISEIFTFVLYDEEKDKFLIAHDSVEVIPLYIEKGKDGKIYFDSKLKALEGLCDECEPFLPGHYFYSKEGEMKRWYIREWTDYESVRDSVAKASSIKEVLEDTVHCQLMSDVPYGILLSGGLDNSVTSAIAKKYATKRIGTDGASDAWWPQPHSFAIGLKGAPDLIKACEVTEYIGTIRHEVNYTVQEGLDAIRDVIYFIKTYDMTMIRASTPMYLLARVIRPMGIKMVSSDEGADEVSGGYLYFHKAPTPEDFHEEMVHRLSELHMYDCLRANESLSAQGVERRVPFLNEEFLGVTMALNPKAKMCPGKEIEKRIVRKTFTDVLPESVTWRQEEQFSDGVGYSWIDTLREITAAAVSDEQIRHVAECFPINTPLNKGEYYYRSIFEECFPNESAARSVPSIPGVTYSTAGVLTWDVAFRDLSEPGGRAMRGAHEETYAEEVK